MRIIMANQANEEQVVTMTNLEKSELRRLCKAGYTFKQIRSEVDCLDATILRYMKVFGSNKLKDTL